MCSDTSFTDHLSGAALKLSCASDKPFTDSSKSLRVCCMYLISSSLVCALFCADGSALPAAAGFAASWANMDTANIITAITLTNLCRMVFPFGNVDGTLTAKQMKVLN